MKYKLKQFGLLAIGLLIGLIGGFAKILKEDYAIYFLSIGIIVEILGIYRAITYHKKIKNQ